MKTPERNRAGGGRLENVSGPLLVRRFSVRQPEMFRVIEMVSAKRLTPLDKPALCELAQAVMDIEYRDLEGDFLEAGCGEGGAAIVISNAKRRSRHFTVHDPSAPAPDIEERLNARFIPGSYESTVPSNGALALAHLACAGYEPMRFLLERLAPRLVSGGCLIIDHYKKEDCRKAVDEYFRGKSGFELVRKSKLHVIKN